VTKRPRSLYHKAIVAATSCSDDEVPYIEALMRDAHGGTLDHLTSVRFNVAARTAHKAYPAMKAADPDWVP
jgi:hypothetical protein